MNHLYLRTALIATLLSPMFVLAQSSPKMVPGSFTYNQKVYNYQFIQESLDSYNLKISGFPTDALAQQPTVKTKTDSLKTVNVPAAADSTKSSKTAAKDTANALDYAFNEFSQQVFIKVFVIQMTSKFNATDNNELRQQAVALFAKIKANLDFLEDEPVTANLMLQKDEVPSILMGNTSAYYDAGLSRLIARHRVERVMVETEDGAIKNIIAYLDYPGKKAGATASPTQYLVFTNLYPISISSKFDPERFANINLYSFNCDGVKGLTRYIKLSDLLALDITLENNKEDYSPADHVYTLSPTQPIVNMKKEKRSHILDVSAFTDFVGLDQQQPNGLIQIEAKRKINLNTHSSLFHKIKSQAALGDNYDLSGYYIEARSTDNTHTTFLLIKQDKTDKNKTDTMRVQVLNTQLKPGYYVWLPSIEPRLLFSKLEDNNRYYLLDTPAFTSKKLDPVKNYQYQLASFGFNLGIYKASFPDAKLSWNVLDAGVYWYRSRVQAAWDTASKHSVPLNNGMLHVNTHVDFHPDSRWGASFTAGRIWQHTWNTIYKLPAQSGLWQAGFDGFLATNDDSKLFFRFRWTADAHQLNNNFTQIQLGYTMNLFTGPSQPKSSGIK